MTSLVQKNGDQCVVAAGNSGLTGPSLGERGADTGRRSITGVLIVANILAYLAMLVCLFHVMGAETFMNTRIFASFGPEQLLRCGANYGPYTLGGQFWRLVTSPFLHSSVLHLAWNMLFLWGLCRQLDRLIGGTRTLAVYLLSGIGCSLAGAWSDPTQVSLGASGCIAGVAGCLVSLLALAKLDLSRLQRRSILLWALFLMPVSIVSGFFSEGVDNAGHLGGLVSGLLIGVVLAWRFRSTSSELRTGGRG